MRTHSAVCYILQATKLQSLYAEAQSDLEAAEGKVVSLSAELEAAQDTAEKLRREMRNLQVLRCRRLGLGDDS
jgi:chromosome segregation ATPase